MSAPGTAKDARASGAKPRLGERVREGGRRPTLIARARLGLLRRAQRRARRRASPQEADARLIGMGGAYKEAEG